MHACINNVCVSVAEKGGVFLVRDFGGTGSGFSAMIRVQINQIGKSSYLKRILGHNSLGKPLSSQNS